MAWKRVGLHEGKLDPSLIDRRNFSDKELSQSNHYIGVNGLPNSLKNLDEIPSPAVAKTRNNFAYNREKYLVLESEYSKAITHIRESPISNGILSVPARTKVKLDLSTSGEVKEEEKIGQKRKKLASACTGSIYFHNSQFIHAYIIMPPLARDNLFYHFLIYFLKMFLVSLTYCISLGSMTLQGIMETVQRRREEDQLALKQKELRLGLTLERQATKAIFNSAQQQQFNTCSNGKCFCISADANVIVPCKFSLKKHFQCKFCLEIKTKICGKKDCITKG